MRARTGEGVDGAPAARGATASATVAAGVTAPLGHRSSRGTAGEGGPRTTGPDPSTVRPAASGPAPSAVGHGPDRCRLEGRSVRAQIAGFALALLLPVCIFAGAIAWRLTEDERARFAQVGREVADNVAEAVDREVGALRASLVALATSPSLATDDIESFSAQARNFLAQSESFGLRISLASAEDGQIILAASWPLGAGATLTREGQGPAWQDGATLNATAAAAAWVQRVAEERTFLVSDLQVDPGTDRPVITLSVPVLQEQRDAPVRLVLSFVTDAETYWSALLDQLAIPDGWIAAMYDRQGRIVARQPEPGRFLGMSIHSEALQAAQEVGDARSSGWARGRDREGNPLLVGWVRPALAPWALLIGVPREAEDGLIERSILPIMVGGGVMMALLTLATAVLGARVLSRPLAALESAAGALGAGRLPPEGPASGIREVDAVAFALRDAAVERQAREAEVTALAARLQAVLDQVPVGVALAEGPSGRIVLANARLREILGRQDPALPLPPFAAPEAYHADGRPLGPDESPLALALASGRAAAAEFRIRRGDGGLRWVRAWAAPVRPTPQGSAAATDDDAVGGEGTPSSAVMALADVEAERQAAEALRESEQRFRTLAEAVPQIVWSTRADGVTDYVNGRLSEITGLPADRVLRSGGDLFVAAIHPDDRTRVLAAWRKALATGDAFAAEMRLRRARGGHGWFVANAIPVRGADGDAPPRWVGAAADVTELVEARQALERQVTAEAAARHAALSAAEALASSEERFRRFAEASPDAIWIADPDGGRLEFLGPAYAQIWGVPEQEAATDTAFRLTRVAEEDRPRLRSVMEAVRAGETRSIEYRIRRPDGELRWIRDITFPIRDASGRPTRIGGLARDVTDRKEAESRQEMLLAELNHRVKNTLATVQSLALQTARGAAAIAEEGGTDPLARFLVDFQARLLALARAHDLLTARVWRGAMLAEVVAAALAPWQSGGATAAGRAERIRIKGPPVWVGPRQALGLAMALHELATNAAKHGALSNAEGRVSLEWRRTQEGEVTLEWTERGGARPASPPRRSGFGARLLRRGLPAELGTGAQVELNQNAPEGVVATIRFRPAPAPDETGALGPTGPRATTVAPTMTSTAPATTPRGEQDQEKG